MKSLALTALVALMFAHSLPLRPHRHPLRLTARSW